MPRLHMRTNYAALDVLLALSRSHQLPEDVGFSNIVERGILILKEIDGRMEALVKKFGVALVKGTDTLFTVGDWVDSVKEMVRPLKSHYSPGITEQVTYPGVPILHTYNSYGAVKAFEYFVDKYRLPAVEGFRFCVDLLAKLMSEMQTKLTESVLTDASRPLLTVARYVELLKWMVECSEKVVEVSVVGAVVVEATSSPPVVTVEGKQDGLDQLEG